MTDTHTKEHSHAQVLRWIADGKRVAHRGQADSAASILRIVALEQPLHEFTLAPRRIKVGSREINAPLREAPASGGLYWIVDCDGKVRSTRWSEHVFDGGALAHGNVWATEADATAARDAWRDLMMGGE